VNKKVLLVVLAALALLILPMSPAMAEVTKVPYAFTTTPIAGASVMQMWTEGNILHAELISVGNYSSPQLGTGRGASTTHATVNLLTGEGTYKAEGIIQIASGPFGPGSISGSSEGKITVITYAPPVLLYTSSGSYAYTHGTGGLEGVKKWGSSERDMFGVSTGVGIIQY